MNAFISYSIGAHEQYILNLLAQKLGETGLTLVTSYNQSNWVDPQTSNDIKNAALFIGLITSAGPLGRTGRVYSEFKLANLHNKPAIFLIEDTVEVAPWVGMYENTVRFNRHYPYQAIEQVRQKIAISQTPQPNSNGAAWILGGLGILALLSWLSEKDK
ncbi:MAG: hypothetical protein ACJ754_18730 [Pyrinomonadaceae bacterium]